jgi:hypothetical protein
MLSNIVSFTPFTSFLTLALLNSTLQKSVIFRALGLTGLLKPQPKPSIGSNWLAQNPNQSPPLGLTGLLKAPIKALHWDSLACSKPSIGSH